jgi:undecaprenyl-diphosphatase
MKLEKRQLLNLGFLCLISFLAFSFFVYFDIFKTLDYKTTVIFQKIIPDFLILPFSSLSVVGSTEFMGIVLLVTLFLFVKTKKLYILALFVVLGLTEIFGKTFVHQKAPPIYFHKTTELLGLPTNGISADLFAYPSGHAGRTAFVSGFLILVIWLNLNLSKEVKIALTIIILGFDLIMFVSRVYLGEHWATDVLGGALIGFSLAFFTSYFLIKTPAKN